MAAINLPATMDDIHRLQIIKLLIRVAVHVKGGILFIPSQ